MNKFSKFWWHLTYWKRFCYSQFLLSLIIIGLGLLLIPFYQAVALGMFLGLASLGLVYLLWTGINTIFPKLRNQLFIYLYGYFLFRMLFFLIIFLCFLLAINPFFSNLKGVELVMKPVNLLVFLFIYQLPLWTYFFVGTIDFLVKKTSKLGKT